MPIACYRVDACLQGLDAAVPLSNNMHLADQLRLHAVVEARMLALSGNEAAAQAAQVSQYLKTLPCAVSAQCTPPVTPVALFYASASGWLCTCTCKLWLKLPLLTCNPSTQSGLRMEQPAIGRIMIVKVYLGKTQTDSSPVCSTR